MKKRLVRKKKKTAKKRKLKLASMRVSVKVLTSHFAKLMRLQNKKKLTKLLKNYNDRWMTLAWTIPFLVIGALYFALSFTSKVDHPVLQTSAKLEHFFDEAKTKTVNERVAFWSDKILHEPTLLYPLGDGPKVNDTAPVFPKGFDCTTYVETVGALSRSDRTNELADNIIAIRYKDRDVAFETRNHFPEADWIPNNISAGILRDITVEVARKAGFVAEYAHKEINKLAWFKEQKNDPADRVVASKSVGTVDVQLAYIPMDKMMNAVQHMPQGTVLNVVRQDRARYPVLISHQGFLIWKNGVPYFRHASRNKEIRETKLTNYMQQLEGMPWQVVGFNLNEFRG